ncbi:MAG: Sir2 family NAD-dependent protein deacetylase [Rothia sp. (in: high G+C Gram-positive bacteria)]|nr:Sir2 family NAD-dependent protein deacetylase [Rothia sp. (in: high G+C Gram-positive bacteria)]
MPTDTRFAGAAENISARTEIAATHRAALRSIQRVVSETARSTDPVTAQAGIKNLLDAGGLLVLTGAGISTGSGIPDYRGPAGSLKNHRPMTYQEFKYDEVARQRYWARSFVGWRQMSRARPNTAHYLLADLQAKGKLAGIITQNVDGLHTAAGAKDVVTLHGDLSRIDCLDCGASEARTSLDTRINAANPGYLERLQGADLQVNPDGDVDLSDSFISNFRMVGCLACGSTKLKPAVVYFGEPVPPTRKAAVAQLLERATSLLVLGSSLAMMSSYKIALDAARAGKPIAVINQGPGRADAKATYLWRADVTDALFALTEQS